MTAMEEEVFDEKYLASIMERNPHLLAHLRIHPWRWRFLTVWILIFTLLVFWAIRQNRVAITQLKENKASLVALQKTNCALRVFLFTAYSARIKTAQDRTQNQKNRAAAAAAARGYHKLYILFPRDNCRSTLKSKH